MSVLRFASGVMATIVAMIAVPLILVSAGLSSLSDDGVATLPTIGVTTSSRALTFGDTEFEYRNGVGPINAADTVSVRAEGRHLFIGIGEPTGVDEFLRSGRSPLTADIWTTRAFGDDPTIDVDPTHGAWSAVVMNIDGTPGVDADLTVSLPSGPVRVVSAALLGAGLMAAIASILLFVVAFRRPNRFDGPEAHEPTREPMPV